MQHRVIIFGYLMAQTGDYHAAEDIFQEVCVTVCEKFDQFEKGTNFKAWVMQITRYKILSYYQGSPKERAMVKLSPEIAETLADDCSELDDDEAFERELAALRECLGGVKGKSRLILLKRYGEGLSCKAVADALNWSVNAVYVALSRVRDALGECIRKRLSAGEA